MTHFILTTIGVLLSTFASSFAQAGTGLDSVGVFYKEDKVVVLINEDRGAPRLNSFFEALGARGLLAEPGRYIFVSKDDGVRIQCARGEITATCTFRFLPSSANLIADRTVESHLSSEELLGTAPVATIEDFEMSFSSSMKDRFLLRLTENGLAVTGSKKKRREI